MESVKNNDSVYDAHYAMLNNEQKRAVDTIEGPVLVVASPGTGKTQLLSLRVAHILQTTDTLASSIVCLTFTDSAAINMRKRLRSIIGKEADKVVVNTFHGLGTEIINANPDYFYKGAEFTPADDLTRLEIMQIILEGLAPDHELRSYHPDIGWVYANQILRQIGDLKKGGLTPDDYRIILDYNKEQIDHINQLFIDFASIPIKQITAPILQEFYHSVSEYAEKQLQSAKATHDNSSQGYGYIQLQGQQSQYRHWIDGFYASTTTMMNAAYASNNSAKVKTKPITAWRDLWGKKDALNKFQLKDALRAQKYYAVAQVYEQYQTMMYDKRLFDFDDMLLDVVETLRIHDDLRYHYQERFQYILVDEFQDTNGVQMALINTFINNEITHNRPNIMVVGDDDQSVYKFQGANLDNILAFRDMYDDVEIITLRYNYRSPQDILDFAQRIIENSQERLAHYDGIDKQLISAQ